MRLLLLQTDIAWHEPERNRARAAELAAGAEADLILLPEMFTTGFTMSPADLPAAERNAGPTLEWMAAMARERDAAVAGSVAVEEGGRFFNRMYFVKPDGASAHYDKRHLFAYASEHGTYTRGDERVVVEWRGVRILLQICYDLRFPVFARNRGDYDMMIFAASWPQSRIAAWDVLLRARAIENACFVAGVNRDGRDPAARYDGHSALLDFKGNPIAEAPAGESAICGSIDMQALAAFRAKFPVLTDADGFEIK